MVVAKRDGVPHAVAVRREQGKEAIGSRDARERENRRLVGDGYGLRVETLGLAERPADAEGATYPQTIGHRLRRTSLSPSPSTSTASAAAAMSKGSRSLAGVSSKSRGGTTRRSTSRHSPKC